MSDDLNKSSLEKVDIDDFFGEDAMRPTSIDDFDAQISAASARIDSATDQSTSEIQLEPTPDLESASDSKPYAPVVDDVKPASASPASADSAAASFDAPVGAKSA